MAGYSVVSTNATGTTFTVADAVTAKQVAGGAGQDTLVYKGTLSATDRSYILSHGSVETVKDDSGTYSATPAGPVSLSLTTGADTVVATASGVTVSATTATLNAGDKLTGGAGTDTLVLTGAGEYHLDTLAAFTGFDALKVVNDSFIINAVVYAPASDLAAVTLQGDSFLQLNGGRVSTTVTGGGGVIARTAADWNPLNTIKAGNLDFSLDLSTNAATAGGQTYDLTQATLSNINNLGTEGKNDTLLVNSAVFAGVKQGIFGDSSGDRLSTADATLTMGATLVYGFDIVSTNTTGTTFTTSNTDAARLVRGGAGQDKLVFAGTLSAADRSYILDHGSVETITDNSGTYKAAAAASFTLTSGSDTFTAPAAGSTVSGTAATLTSGDKLTGGAGVDTLTLSGGGTFHLDTLATFTGFDAVKVATPVEGLTFVLLPTGTSAINLDFSGRGTGHLYLNGGRVTITDSDTSLNIHAHAAADWNPTNNISAETLSFETIRLSDPLSGQFTTSSNQTYDFTKATFFNVNQVIDYGSKDIIQLNSAAAAGVALWTPGSLSAAPKLSTADATLDLSPTKVGEGFAVVSTNATGTTFTAADLTTARQVAGGAGQDTLVYKGTLTVDDRTYILGHGSVETVKDDSGTYKAVGSGGGGGTITPPASGTTVALTTADDTIVAPSGGVTVTAISTTLNNGDKLTGGAGQDTLALSGGGSFHLDQLKTFTGFETVTVETKASNAARAYLGIQDLQVMSTGAGDAEFYLGKGLVSVALGSNSGSVFISYADAWNGQDTISGASTQGDDLYLSYGAPRAAQGYDLTKATLSGIELVSDSNIGDTIAINSATAAGVANWFGGDGSQTLITADAAIDLSRGQVRLFGVTSTRAGGTAFTVGDIGSAFQVVGGPGQDTVFASGFTFTAAQRGLLFGLNAVETLHDSTGSYFAVANANAFRLTTGADTIATAAAGGTVYATSRTLNAGDRLTGGAGTDTLALYGSGTFSLDQLAAFSGFETVTFDNFDGYAASMNLGGQALALTIGSGQLQVYLGAGRVALTVQAAASPGVSVADAAHWNTGDAITAAAGTNVTVYFSQNTASAQTYDLTGATLSGVAQIIGLAADVTLKVNTAAANGVARWYSGSVGVLTTSDATLNLTQGTVEGGFTVVSTNATGTAFTVADSGTASTVRGGAGQDSLIAQGFTFSAAQRTAIFSSASIETIQDSTGVYHSASYHAAPQIGAGSATTPGDAGFV